MHESMGPEARWRRFTADLLHIIASGRNIDANKTPGYGEILKEIYHDPFVKRVKEPKTAKEIISYITGKVEDLLNGIA